MKKSVFLGLLVLSIFAAQSSMAAGKFYVESASDKARLNNLADSISKLAINQEKQVREYIEKGKHSEALRVVLNTPGVKAELSRSTGLKVLDIETIAKSREEAAMAMISLQASGAKEALTDFGNIMQKLSNDTAAQEIVSFIAMEAATKDSAKTTLKEIVNSKDIRATIEAFGKSKGLMSFADLLDFIRKCLKA